MLRSINLIVLHCSATPSGRPISSGVPGNVTAADVIDSWHKQRGFKRAEAAARAFNPQLLHIGYHCVIDVTGEVFTGRHFDEAGAHAANFNANSIGVCLVGGIEREGQFTPPQWKALKNTVLGLAHQLRIPLARPLRSYDVNAPGGFRVTGGICGHRDLSPDQDKDGEVKSNEWLKTCPGFDVNAWLANRLDPLPAHIFGADA